MSSAHVHVHDTFVAAPPIVVWEGLVEPDQTERFFRRTCIESSFEPGEPDRYVLASSGRRVVSGTIEMCESPRRLMMTWRMPDGESIEGNWHRAQAVDVNNSVWEFLDERDHTADEADELLQRADAAAYHRRRATGATVVNEARAIFEADLAVPMRTSSPMDRSRA